MAVTPQERATYARRRYNIADRWWQESPRGAAAQRGRTQPRQTAPAARGPVRTGGRMGPNFTPRSTRAMVLPTGPNRASGLPRWRAEAARQNPYLNGGAAAGGGLLNPGIAIRRGRARDPSGYFQTMMNRVRAFSSPEGAFNNWRYLDRAGRAV